MTSSTAKRVLLYRFDRQPLEAVVNPAAYLLEDSIELITLSGNIQTAAYVEFKALCFVAEGSKPDLFTAHTLFERRPKVPGLWTRFTFRDGDQLDGLLSHNLLDWPQAGYLITPPRAGAARQKVFIPRRALAATELRGVVGSSAPAGRKKPESPLANRQLTIFDS